MARRKISMDKTPQQFDLLEDDNQVFKAGEQDPHPAAVTELPQLREDTKLNMLEQLDMLLQQIGDTETASQPTLSSFILRSFYVEGKSITEIAEQLQAGVEGLRPVTRERVRMIVVEICDELLRDIATRKCTKGIALKDKFLNTLRAYSEDHVGVVVRSGKMLANPRLTAIAALMRMRVVVGDTTIPWIKKQAILLSDNIEKRHFNTHYASLFYLLQKEVRPMALEDILQQLPEQRQWSGCKLNGELIRFLLTHDEVFETMDDGRYQLRFPYLNITQQIARIIYEEKDITPSDLKRLYLKRTGLEKLSSMAVVSKNYKWCVPIGKSKWVYREDGMRNDTPAEIVHRYCMEHVRFSFDDVMNHLSSMGINITTSSVRCYIMLDCRRLNADKDQFCLTDHVPESEEHLWYSKQKARVSHRVLRWRETMKEEVHTLLLAAPSHRMLQKDVLNSCKHIFDRRGISYNSFYKVVVEIPWLQVIEIDGAKYLQLCEE